MTVTTKCYDLVMTVITKCRNLVMTVITKCRNLVMTVTTKFFLGKTEFAHCELGLLLCIVLFELLLSIY